MLLTVLGGDLARPATQELALDVPDRREASFETSFDVEHAGKLSLSASWPSARVLWFRLEGPGKPPLRVQGSGPSPQRLQIDVKDETIALGTKWKMSIRALPDRGAVRATIVLELPEPPEPEEQQRTEAPVAEPAPPAERWRQATAASPDASTEVRAVFESIGQLRNAVVAQNGEIAPDSCSWTIPFLVQMTAFRDALAERPLPIEEERRGCFRQVVETVRSIDDLRRSVDPGLAGPPPEEPEARLEWRFRRSETIRPIERGLDELQESVRDGRCPREDGNWLPRLIACVTACERYFESRGRLGENGAPNGELARDQWERILRAASVLEAVAARPAAVPAAEPPRATPSGIP